MLGKIAGAIIGKRTAQHLDGISGPWGAALGVGAATMLKRAGPVGLIAALAGGYALKRHRQKQERASHARPSRRPSAAD